MLFVTRNVHCCRPGGVVVTFGVVVGMFGSGVVVGPGVVGGGVVGFGVVVGSVGSSVSVQHVHSSHGLEPAQTPVGDICICSTTRSAAA